jgi:ABC-type antimicrobial peptide transport system permease subunit
VDRDIPIPQTQTMSQIVDRAVADRRLELLLMGMFGSAAAILAALGVYGVVAYSVASRTREMGIRAALGATPFDIRRQVVAEGVLPVSVGLVVGLLASWPIGRAMASVLFQVRPAEPLAMVGVAAVLIASAVIACLGPARRAAGSTVLSADS